MMKKQTYIIRAINYLKLVGIKRSELTYTVEEATRIMDKWSKLK